MRLQDQYLLLCGRRKTTNTTTCTKWPHVHVFDQTAKNRLHERGPNILYWNLCSYRGTMQISWRSPENTRTGWSSTGTLFSSQMRARFDHPRCIKFLLCLSPSYLVFLVFYFLMSEMLISHQNVLISHRLCEWHYEYLLFLQILQLVSLSNLPVSLPTHGAIPFFKHFCKYIIN